MEFLRNRRKVTTCRSQFVKACDQRREQKIADDERNELFQGHETMRRPDQDWMLEKYEKSTEKKEQ